MGAMLFEETAVLFCWLKNLAAPRNWITGWPIKLLIYPKRRNGPARLVRHVSLGTSQRCMED